VEVGAEEKGITLNTFDRQDGVINEGILVNYKTEGDNTPKSYVLPTGAQFSKLQAVVDSLVMGGVKIGSYATIDLIPTNVSDFPSGQTPTLSDFVTIQSDADHGGLRTQYYISDIVDSTGVITWAFDGAFDPENSDILVTDFTGNILIDSIPDDSQPHAIYWAASTTGAPNTSSGTGRITRNGALMVIEAQIANGSLWTTTVENTEILPIWLQIVNTTMLPSPPTIGYTPWVNVNHSSSGAATNVWYNVGSVLTAQWTMNPSIHLKIINPYNSGRSMGELFELNYPRNTGSARTVRLTKLVTGGTNQSGSITQGPTIIGALVTNNTDTGRDDIWIQLSVNNVHFGIQWDDSTFVINPNLTSQTPLSPEEMAAITYDKYIATYKIVSDRYWLFSTADDFTQEIVSSKYSIYVGENLSIRTTADTLGLADYVGSGSVEGYMFVQSIAEYHYYLTILATGEHICGYVNAANQSPSWKRGSDQTYNATSILPQSGKAVAAGIAAALTTVWGASY
jgi:hypothetical protein